MLNEKESKVRSFSFIRFLLGTKALEEKVAHMEYRIMSAIDDLNTAVAKLSTDVAALIASDTSTATTAAVVAATAALTSLDGTVVAATPVAPAPVA